MSEESTRLNQAPVEKADTETPAAPPAAGKPAKAKKLTPKEARAAKAAQKKAVLEARAAAQAQKVSSGDVKWPPFIDTDSLPQDVQLDKKGKVVKDGTPRFGLRTGSNGNVKLIAFFRNGLGLASRLVKTLRVGKKNSVGKRDRDLLREIKACGVHELTDY